MFSLRQTLTAKQRLKIKKRALYYKKVMSVRSTVTKRNMTKVVVQGAWLPKRSNCWLCACVRHYQLDVQGYQIYVTHCAAWCYRLLFSIGTHRARGYGCPVSIWSHRVWGWGHRWEVDVFIGCGAIFCYFSFELKWFVAMDGECLCDFMGFGVWMIHNHEPVSLVLPMGSFLVVQMQMQVCPYKDRWKGYEELSQVPSTIRPDGSSVPHGPDGASLGTASVGNMLTFHGSN